jgi:hypothetical protein
VRPFLRDASSAAEAASRASAARSISRRACERRRGRRSVGFIATRVRRDDVERAVGARWVGMRDRAQRLEERAGTARKRKREWEKGQGTWRKG